jgi:hypothetical protein
MTATPEQYAGLSDAGKATLEAALTKAGASSEQLASLKAPAADKGKEVIPSSALDALYKNGKPGNTDPAYRPPATAAANEPYERKVQAFKNLIGKVDEATLQKAAREEGIEWSAITKEAPTEPPKNMGVSEANEKLAATEGPFAAGTDPNDYRFQFEQRHVDGLDATAVREIHDMFAAGAFESGIPLSIAPAVAREAVNAANAFDNLDEMQTRFRYAEEGTKLKRLGNIEQIAENHAYARSKLPQWFVEAADEARFFHTADSFLALARAGELMKLRDSRKK